MIDSAKVDDVEPLLRLENVSVEFGRQNARASAVSDVSLEVFRGETLGLVGESGCGKSSLANAIMQLPPPTSGKVVFEGADLTTLHGRELREMRPRLQMIFQDPMSSLNPRRSVTKILKEPIVAWKRASSKEADELVYSTLSAVGIDPRFAKRRPRQFSVGQCQRISIARSLVLNPHLLVCDEAVSSLDVSVQAQILNLLEDLKAQRSLTMIFISHNLSVVKNISDRVAVMYLGRLCEVSTASELYGRPKHPYTEALLRAIPDPNPRVTRRHIPLQGELPSIVNPPSGCRFRTRCPRATELCATTRPELRPMSDGHYVACHYPTEHPAAVAAG